MSKVTSKLQLTIPKAIANQYGINPGDELVWTPTGETIRIGKAHSTPGDLPGLTLEEKIALFRESTARLKKILAAGAKKAVGSKPSKDRGWTREELYTRGFPR